MLLYLKINKQKYRVFNYLILSHRKKKIKKQKHADRNGAIEKMQ